MQPRWLLSHARGYIELGLLAEAAAELDQLGVPEADWNEYLTRTALALRGWAGMIRHLEERPDRAPVEPVPARLVDFVALRLVCDRVAVEWASRQLGFKNNNHHESNSHKTNNTVIAGSCHGPRSPNLSFWGPPARVPENKNCKLSFPLGK